MLRAVRNSGATCLYRTRLTAAGAAAGAPSICATCTPRFCSTSHAGGGSGVSDSRMAAWCKRLWALSARGKVVAASTNSRTAAASAAAAAAAATDPLGGTQPAVTSAAAASQVLSRYMREAAASGALAKDGIRTGLASGEEPHSPPQHPQQQQQQSGLGAGDDMTSIIAELKTIVESDASSSGGGRKVPLAVVETLWRVYDELLPYDVQRDLANRLRDSHINNFFSFTRLLAELDFDVRALDAAMARLSAAVQRCKDLSTELEKLSAVSQKLQQQQQQPGAGVSESSSSGDAPFDMERYRKLYEELDRCKSLVTKTSIEVRGAGAPLFYLWLRHSASLEGGLRRLMDFRKTVHYFDIMCRRQIKALTKQQLHAQGPAGKAEADAADAADAAAVTRALLQWHERQRDIRSVDAVLSTLFLDFFSKEYLVMEELTWFGTPPALLEQIMAAESVQPFVNGLADMKQRLQPAHHRHLFSFLHPAVVEEPLIAVQVALTRGIASSVNAILGHATPLADPANTTDAAQRFRASQQLSAGGGDEDVDTAIFYSINSAQSALRGMDMGNALIKRVVKEIDSTINASRAARGLSRIVTYSTLSPIPGYTRWLGTQLERLKYHQRQLELGKPARAGAAHNDDGGADGSGSAADATVATTANLTAPPSVFCDSDWADGGRVAGRFHADLRAALKLYLRARSPEDPGNTEAIVDSFFNHGGECLWKREQLPERRRVITELVKTVLELPEGAGEPPSAAEVGAPTAQQVAAQAACVELLLDVFHSGAPWWRDHAFTAALERPHTRSVAHYLAREKRSAASRRILDPVGNFHVSNGATIFRVNYLGNCGAQGSRESGCTMVNYWYNTDRITENMSVYKKNKTVTLGDFMSTILKDD